MLDEFSLCHHELGDARTDKDEPGRESGKRDAPIQAERGERIDDRTDECENQKETAFSSTYYSGAQLLEMNAKFIAAMAAAIRAGLEHPPRVGIDSTPGTKNPSHYIPPRR